MTSPSDLNISALAPLPPQVVMVACDAALATIDRVRAGYAREAEERKAAMISEARKLKKGPWWNRTLRYPAEMSDAEVWADVYCNDYWSLNPKCDHEYYFADRGADKAHESSRAEILAIKTLAWHASGKDILLSTEGARLLKLKIK